MVDKPRGQNNDIPRTKSNACYSMLALIVGVTLGWFLGYFSAIDAPSFLSYMLDIIFAILIGSLMGDSVRYLNATRHMKKQYGKEPTTEVSQSRFKSSILRIIATLAYVVTYGLVRFWAMRYVIPGHWFPGDKLR
jgi:hypothetical protein